MKKLYLSQDGTVRMTAPGEHDHLDMARATLGPGWNGDIEATYAAMWNAGWVRVVDTPSTLYGEKLVNRIPVPYADLPRAQREWLDANSVLVGKQFVWNSTGFERTREAQNDDAHVAQERGSARLLSDMKIYLSKDGVVRTPSGEEHSHFGMAKTILGADWRGDREAAYAAMWDAGWVRVVETVDKVIGERYLNGQPVPFNELRPAQRGWFDKKRVLDGKLFVWNDQQFASTRETLVLGGDKPASTSQTGSAPTTPLPPIPKPPDKHPAQTDPSGT